MRLFLRKIAVLIVAAGLILSGATSHAHATMAAGSTGAAAAHQAHQVENYADLAIEPGDEDCLRASGDTSTPQPQNDSPCMKCCAACTSVSLMAIEATPVLILSHVREIYPATRAALVAETVATEPGIPKPL
jgi:hypothetical protein